MKKSVSFISEVEWESFVVRLIQFECSSCHWSVIFCSVQHQEVKFTITNTLLCLIATGFIIEFCCQF